MDLDVIMQRLFRYDLAAAITCILTPLILFIGDGPRSSISDYAYSNIDFIYVFLLTVAATLITTIGVRKDRTLTWVLGIILMLIPLTPYKSVPNVHLFVSILFFGGMSYHIIQYTNTFKKFRWFLFGAIAILFSLYSITDWFTLFFVESAALIIFGVNFMVDLIGDKNDLDSIN